MFRILTNESMAEVSETEVLTELRHKFLTILKSQYWEFFEHGLCMPDSVVLLMESADECMDDEHLPMVDFKHIEETVISDTRAQALFKAAQQPCVGGLFNNYLVSYLTISYDVIINFIEGHDKAVKMFTAIK